MAALPRWRGWRPKVRWFAAEYLIVVLGVLTAVALNAWWQGRQDAATEAEYLRQLASDMGGTERMLNRVEEGLAPSHRASERLFESFRTAEPLSADSIRMLVSAAVEKERARPILGTVEALIATGTSPSSETTRCAQRSRST